MGFPAGLSLCSRQPRRRALLVPSLPHREFRVPLLVALLDLDGVAPAKLVREHMEPMLAARLSQSDYARVSSGEPRWWNAVCWVRIDLVSEGLLKGNCPGGFWEISKQGKALPTSYCRRANGRDQVIAQGSLEEMVRKHRKAP
ncbi:winged helix-turn-helix domain-containing protein [Bradyrhizobium sp. USDA 4011]